MCKARSTTPDVFGIGHARLGHSAFGATLADGKLSLDSTWTNSTHLDSALTSSRSSASVKPTGVNFVMPWTASPLNPQTPPIDQVVTIVPDFFPSIHGTVCRVKHADLAA